MKDTWLSLKDKVRYKESCKHWKQPKKKRFKVVVDNTIDSLYNMVHGKLDTGKDR